MKGTRRRDMGSLPAWIYSERFSKGQRVVRRMHTHERRPEGVTPQRIGLRVVSECDNSFLIEIVLLDCDGVLVFRCHLCDGAHVSRAKPKQEKTHNPESKKDVRGPENHVCDCSDKGPMNQVSWSVQAMPVRRSHTIGTDGCFLDCRKFRCVMRVWFFRRIV
jgi:hypothetical protein